PPALPPPRNCRIREANGPEAVTSHIRQRNGGRPKADSRQWTGRAAQAAASTSAGFARSVHASATAAVVITPPKAKAQLAPLAWAACAEAPEAVATAVPRVIRAMNTAVPSAAASCWRVLRIAEPWPYSDRGSAPRDRVSSG